VEATCSSEMCVEFNLTALCYITEDRTRNNHRCEKFKSNKLLNMQIKSNLKGSDYGVSHLELLGLWTLPMVQNSE
jgi:hypothetical protein